ncbi:MAG: PEP-CTERM sorting domain-containing protein [Bryobacteraceae bacterium]|nr:PEP-CTERM sorting domain-containing protein [Bryobacteraceae bacterium]
MKNTLAKLFIAGLMGTAILSAGPIPVRISFDGLDFNYNPGTGTICDANTCNFGTAAVGDSIDTLNFRINGVVVPTPSATNPVIDMLLNVGALPLNGSVNISTTLLNVFDIWYNGGSLINNITSGTVNITTTCQTGGAVPACTNNLVTITVLGQSVNLTSLASDFPAELGGIANNTFTPVVLTFSGNFSGLLPQSELGGFSAQGSGELQGTVPEVPEPMTMSLIGGGLAGLALLRRRATK